MPANIRAVAVADHRCAEHGGAGESGANDNRAESDPVELWPNAGSNHRRPDRVAYNQRAYRERTTTAKTLYYVFAI